MRLNLFGPLMPREEAFIELFCELATTVLAAAHAFHGLVAATIVTVLDLL